MEFNDNLHLPSSIISFISKRWFSILFEKVADFSCLSEQAEEMEIKR